MSEMVEWVVEEPKTSGVIASFAEARSDDINEKLLEMGYSVGEIAEINPDRFWKQHFDGGENLLDLEIKYDLFVCATEHGEMVSVDVAKKVIEYVEQLRETTGDCEG